MGRFVRAGATDPAGMTGAAPRGGNEAAKFLIELIELRTAVVALLLMCFTGVTFLGFFALTLAGRAAGAFTPATKLFMLTFRLETPSLAFSARRKSRRGVELRSFCCLGSRGTAFWSEAGWWGHSLAGRGLYRGRCGYVPIRSESGSAAMLGRVLRGTARAAKKAM